MPTPRKEAATEDAPVRWEYDKIVPYAARSQPLARPTPGIFDSPYVCLRINILWLPHIMGALDVLTAWDAWQGDNDGLSARDEIEKLFAAMKDGGACLEFGESIMLRQNPTNLCLLEQSVDGGDTWTLAFDFSKCGVIKAGQDNFTLNQFNTGGVYTQNVWNDYQTNYDGTLGSIAPELPYGTTDEDAARDAALCAALVRLIDIVCDVSISFYRDLDEAQSARSAEIAFFGAIVGLIALAAAIPTAGASLVAFAAGASLMAAGFGLSFIVGNALYDKWQAHEIDQFQDELAKDDVVCFLYNELKGTDVTQADFATALESHGLTGNAAAIADVTTEIIALEQNYAAFVEEWERDFSQTRLGIDLGCPCEDGWEVAFPTDEPFSRFTALTFSGATTTIDADSIDGHNDTSNAAVYLNFEIELTGSVSHVEFDVEYAFPTPFQQFVLSDEDGEIDSFTLNGGSPVTIGFDVDRSGTHTYTILAGVQGSAAAGRFLRVVGMRWAGSGANPFE